jgi:hypothetical protein
MITKDSETKKEIYFNWTVFFYLLPFSVIIIPFIADKSANDYYIILIWSTIIPILFIPGLKYIYYYLSSKPALTFTQTNLYDYRAKLEINWSDIQELKIVFRRGPFASIKLKDNDKYLSRIDNSGLKLIYRIRTKISHGIFLIELGSNLKGNYKDIFSIMNTYLIESKQITE